MSRAGRTVVTAAVALTVTAAGFVVTPVASAADGPDCTTSWIGGSGNWSDGSRWTTGAAPTTTDHVCVLRAAGAPRPAVVLRSSVLVKELTLSEATLRVPSATTTLETVDLGVTRGAVVGPGTVRSRGRGVARFTDATLGPGGTVRVDGSSVFAGTETFAGGARLDQNQSGAFGRASFDGDVSFRSTDGTGHVTLSTADFWIAAGQTVDVEVPFHLGNTGVNVAGTLRVPDLDDLDASGRFAPPTDTFSRFVTSGAGRVEFARTITSLGTGAILTGGNLVTTAGTDALADLATDEGWLTLDRPLDLPRELEIGVGGILTTTSTLSVTGLVVRDQGTLTAQDVVSPVVQSDKGSTVDARSVSGRLEYAGTAYVGGSRFAELDAVRSSTTWFDLMAGTAVVDGVANLAGPAKLLLHYDGTGLPRDGTQFVLVSATGGISGRFSALGTGRIRGTATLTYTPTQVIATYHRPG